MVYKLYYFNIRGLAEPIRYLLSYGGIDFEDHRIERADWPSIKDTMPMKQMPVLDIDGKKYFQSVAICRYLGSKFGLGGKDADENVEIDMVIETFVDFRQKVSQAFQSPEDKKPEAMQKLKEEHMPFYLSKLNEMAEQNGGHLACNRQTWIDFYVTALSGVVVYCAGGSDPFAPYPGLKKVIESVESIDSIKKWISKRPVTEM